MSYRHEIFISYKWEDDDHQEWVRDVLYPILEAAIYQEFVKKEEAVFLDREKIKYGEKVRKELYDGVVYSKCMVGIVSKPYFIGSQWCPTEFSSMQQREDYFTKIKKITDIVLIFPLIFVNEKKDKKSVEYTSLNDHKEIADLIFNMSPLCLDWKYKGTNKAFRDGDNYNALKNIIREWVSGSIRKHIVACPDWEDYWSKEEYFISAYNEFTSHYSLPVAQPNPQMK